MLRCLLFDVDGTLVSMNVDGERLRATMAAELQKWGFDTSFIGGGVYSQDIIDRAKLQVETGSVKADFRVVREQLYAALDALEMDWNARSEPIEGARAVLARLRTTHPDVKLATLTNSGRAPSEWLLRKYDLLKYFDYTFSRDNLPAMKPRPEAVLHAVQEVGVRTQEAMFVGDSVIDVRSAKGAGVRIASVVTGRYTAEKLREEGTDYVLGSLWELFNLLN